jgi:prepilin-type N-terminal cleavage/methylation domain-containing protein
MTAPQYLFPGMIDMSIFKRGITLVELIIVILIFSLFMIVIYSTLDVGFKMWKLGETRTDVESKSESFIRRMAMEIRNSNSYAIIFNEPDDPNSIYHSDTPYICFETPVYNGEVKYKEDTGDILWQGFILYYAMEDPNDHASRILYRRYLPHNSSSPYYSDSSVNPQMADPNSVKQWITEKPPLSLPGQSLTVCSKVKNANFNYKNSLVNMKFEFEEQVRGSKSSRVMISGKGAVYKFMVETSVKPEN